MKPVAILRFSPDDGPGYFASFLERHSIPWTLFRIDAGERVPSDLDAFSGFVFMGGPMSANDALPWIAPTIELMRRALRDHRPCLGHCLGGQLMAKALGGEVMVNPVKEIGWNPVFADDSAIARQWLGDETGTWTAFQWHGDTFTIPPGATRILTGHACENQAYVIGNSLGMQCHTEMTPEAIEEWCGDWDIENADPSLPSIQTPEEMRAMMQENLPALRRLADRLYSTWIAGLAKKLMR
jgi:GMP synthase-like glutamine amidotransferase